MANSATNATNGALVESTKQEFSPVISYSRTLGSTDDQIDEAEDEGFKPLTRQEAEKIRQLSPAISLWRLVVSQVVVGIFVTLGVWVLTGQLRMLWSAGYGALAVVIPASLFARGLSRQKSVMQVNAALTGFFVWELVKIALTVAMLLAAPRVIAELSWLALVAGFVVTMKVYWVAMWFRPARKDSIKNF